ncbi:MAG: hypothetical protein A2293_12185 [Elusimicrobia bacterium RIFOXYB2_FULL_49_7]|nr:MAG: hypothetical protein A2293_12185 [Elusimicrobia bacterium RIFOXYB2_FULL_49_7]
MDLEKKWQAIFSQRALAFNTPHEISHWTEQGFHRRFNAIGKRLKKLHQKGQRVLDLGAGPGPYARFFDSPVLADYSFNVLQKVPPDPPTLRVCADLDHLPFRPETFDGLLCVGLLQCRRMKPDDLAALAALLKPGGWFLFETLNCDCRDLDEEMAPFQKTMLSTFRNAKSSAPAYFVYNDFVLYHSNRLETGLNKAGFDVTGKEFLYSELPAPAEHFNRFLADLGLFANVERLHSRSFILYGIKSRRPPHPP